MLIEGATATAFLDMMAVLIWPLLVAAAIWAIAVHAFAEADEITGIVEALTQTARSERPANAAGGWTATRSRRTRKSPLAWPDSQIERNEAHTLIVTTPAE